MSRYPLHHDSLIVVQAQFCTIIESLMKWKPFCITLPSPFQSTVLCRIQSFELITDIVLQINLHQIHMVAWLKLMLAV